MAQPFPEEITLRILQYFNDYNEFSSKNTEIRLKQKSGANHNPKAARIARQVCKPWKALVDLRSSYQFRVTSAGITFEAPYLGLGGNRTTAEYLESKRARLSALRS